MALTPAEKQRRYRARHLGPDGSKEQLQFFVSVQAAAQLKRLARHRGYSLTRTVEILTGEAEAAVLAKLPAKAQNAYFDGV